MPAAPARPNPAPRPAPRLPPLGVALAFALLAAGCARESTPPETTRPDPETESRAIVETLDALIRLSDAATLPVGVTLLTGERAEARTPRPRPLPDHRPPLLPDPVDPLGTVARTVHPALANPAAFDWAPGSSTVLLVAEADAIRSVDLDRDESRRWLALPPGDEVHQVLSAPDGRVLLVLADRAWIAEWNPDDPGPPDVLESPEDFEFNYMAWADNAESTVGLLEYLHFATALEALGLQTAEDDGLPDEPPERDDADDSETSSFSEERLVLGGSRWTPGETWPGRFPGPPLDDVAWIAGAPALGRWVSLPKQPQRIDPFPAALRLWDEPDRQWHPFTDSGLWTDTAPSFAHPPEATLVVWLRRLHPHRQTGRPWLRIHPDDDAPERHTDGHGQARTDTDKHGRTRTDDMPPPPGAPEESGLFAPWCLGGDCSDIPLGECELHRIVLSQDGRRLAFVPAEGANAGALRVADREAASAAARTADMPAREIRRRETQRQLRQDLEAVWAERARAASSEESASAPTPPAFSPAAEDDPPALRDNDPERATARLAEGFAAAVEARLGLRADRTLASVEEIETRLGRLGGDFAASEAAVACLAAYYGETLRDAGDVHWDLAAWPPTVPTDREDPETTFADPLAHTLHNPFAAAAQALDGRLSLAALARDLLATHPYPVWLTDRPPRLALARLLHRAALETGLHDDSPADPRKVAERFLESDRRNTDGTTTATEDFALYVLIEYGDFRDLPGVAWRLAAERVRRRPACASAFATLGYALAQEGWTQHAARAYAHAMRLDPAEAAHVVGAALTAFDNADYDRAHALFHRVRALDRLGLWRDTVEAALESYEPRQERGSRPSTQ